MSKTVRVAALGAVAALTVSMSAYAAATHESAATQRVAVGMSEFKFTLAPKTVKKNVVVTFALTNNGTIGHDFRIGGKKSAVLAAGKKATLKVTFKKAGRFPYLCTLPSHAAAGMKGVLVVK